MNSSATEATSAFLADSFGVPGPAALVPVTRGAMGAVWRLEPADGPAYAAKELFWFDPGPEAVAAELGFVGRCRAAGVPSPRAVPAPDGAYVVTDPAGARWWRLYEWVEGRPPDRQDPDTAVWLMRQMARIHALSATDPPTPVDRWYHRIDVDWPGLADAATGAGLPWAGRLTASLPRMRELTDLVNQVPAGPAVWCHRDLNGSNVLAGPVGRWLVDWDNAGPLEPWREFGALLTEHIGDHAALTRLATAYAETEGPVSPTAQGGAEMPAGAAVFATGLAVWLNFLAEQARAVLERGADNWSIARVEGLLGPFPTVTGLTAAADLVGEVLIGG